MRATPRLLLGLISLVSVPAFAAKKSAADPQDAAPQLISTKGNAPKWKNLEELKQFALRGDPQACFELADRNVEGDGVPRDIKQASALFERAAKGGVANGWFRLGKIYHDGLDGAPDYARALDYFTLAARSGVTEAQFNIGAMLVSGRGVKRDYIEGLAWLIVAKKSGAPSDAEEQVRGRMARRPPDITAAETRAAEISADLPNATVRTGASAAGTPPTKPAEPPKVDRPAPVKSGVVAPKLDPVAPPKIDVPVAPAEPPSAPKKSDGEIR
jgi:TPR repeat protein